MIRNIAIAVVLAGISFSASSKTQFTPEEQAYLNCIDEGIGRARAERLLGNEMHSYARSFCSTQEQQYRASLVKQYLAEGQSQEDANNNADRGVSSFYVQMSYAVLMNRGGS